MPSRHTLTTNPVVGGKKLRTRQESSVLFEDDIRQIRSFMLTRNLYAADRDMAVGAIVDSLGFTKEQAESAWTTLTGGT